jgi:hypothetical protein
MNETLPSAPPLVELDDLAYYVATTYGQQGRKNCWEVSIDFEDSWDTPQWDARDDIWDIPRCDHRDEWAHLRLANSQSWTLAHFPTREVGQRGAEYDAKAWARTDSGLYRVKSGNSVTETPQKLAKLVRPHEVVRSHIGVRRAKAALELMNLRLSNPA